jgi:hypothetical protein
VKLGFLSKWTDRKVSKREQYANLVRKCAVQGGALNDADQIALREIADEAGIDEAKIQRDADTIAAYISDRVIADTLPALRQSASSARAKLAAYKAETIRIANEREAEENRLAREQGLIVSQLDNATAAKARVNISERANWKTLALPRVVTQVHLFDGNPQKMMKPGVVASLDLANFANGKLDADDYEFVKHFSQCQDAFDALIKTAKGYRKLPTDQPATTVIKDAIHQPAPTLSLRNVNGDAITVVEQPNPDKPTWRDGAIPSTLPENNRNQSKWQVQIQPGAL